VEWTNKYNLSDRVIPAGFKIIPRSGKHYITKDGKVWSCRLGRLLKLHKNKVSGRLQLEINGTTRTVHRLVLEAFVGKCPKGMECRHLDGNSLNNNINNLCWGTRSENQRDSVKHGTHGGIKLTKNIVNKIRERLSNGELQRIIAKDYNISQSEVSLISVGRRWNCDMD